LKVRAGLDTEIPEEVFVLVTTKLPLRVPLVKSLTSVSWGVVPMGAPAQIEAKFVWLNPSALRPVVDGVRGRVWGRLLIGTFGVTKAWAGLTPTKREPVATAAAKVLRMESMGRGLC
jgi:hypothetical protein